MAGGKIASSIDIAPRNRQRLMSKYKNSENRPCICTLCGDNLNILTHVHAEKHGFKNKYEMMEAGMVKWI